MGFCLLFYISGLFAETDTSTIDRPVAQQCKNYIGYTAGTILLEGISYRRWVSKKVGLQLTASLSEKSSLDFIADSSRSHIDSLYYYAQQRTVGIAIFINVFRYKNLEAVGYITGHLLRYNTAYGSVMVPQPGIGGGLEFTIWRITTMGAIGMTPSAKISPPYFLDFGCYFAF